MFSIQELRSSTKKELQMELEKSRKEMLKVRINLRTKHEKDTSKALKTKTYIARILTVMKDIKDEVKEVKSEKSVTPKKTVKKRK